MRDFLKTCFTSKDNATGDIGRVLWALSFVAFFAFQARAASFDGLSFTAACVALLTGGAGALRIKATTEPEGK
jgi:hypothetical protein